MKVEPFGNVAKDAKTGRATVHEVIEPPVDVFEEADHVLVVAELPGVSDEDIKLELRDDVLDDPGRARAQEVSQGGPPAGQLHDRGHDEFLPEWRARDQAGSLIGGI